MSLIDCKQPINALHKQILDHYQNFDSDDLRHAVLTLEQKACDTDFWNNREHAEKTLTKIKRLKSIYEPWEKLIKDSSELQEFYELAYESSDETLESEISQTLKNLEKQFQELTTIQVLSDESDPFDCYVTIHAGAGGTEACDWARMLSRMYIRYAEDKSFNLEIVDEQSEDCGIKSLTMAFKGTYAYGFLKGETGIHRLVRISPFDSGGRRHTSFASVYVTPILDDTITIDIRPEDLRVDTYRASGAGGQKVNKTSSAVRMTHLETGIVVQCQNERSQHQNRDIAMSMLKGRLYEHYKNVRDTERAKVASVKHNIGFGSQIRSYVFQPYTMVKDQRTKMQTSAVDDVMDGKIQPFIDAYLRFSWEKNAAEQQEKLL